MYIVNLQTLKYVVCLRKVFYEPLDRCLFEKTYLEPSRLAIPCRCVSPCLSN